MRMNHCEICCWRNTAYADVYMYMANRTEHSTVERCRAERRSVDVLTHIPLVIQNNNGNGVCVFRNWAERKREGEVQRTGMHGMGRWVGESMTTVKNMATPRRILYQVFILILFMSLWISWRTYMDVCTNFLFWKCELVFFPIFATSSVNVCVYAREIEF